MQNMLGLPKVWLTCKIQPMSHVVGLPWALTIYPIPHEHSIKLIKKFFWEIFSKTEKTKLTSFVQKDHISSLWGNENQYLLRTRPQLHHLVPP